MKRNEQLKKITDIQKKQNGRFDSLVVGGGINGAIAALCLAQRGFSVLLVEAGDFAGQTSQESSNLIWGGIKYLENFELGLVRKLSKSRNKLLEKYPDLVKELRFLVPYNPSNKHGLLKLYLGAWFYWFWGGLKTRIPYFHRLSSLKKTKFPLNFKKLRGGFEYSDAYLIENDARFVFNFIREAEGYGAAVLNYVQLKSTKQYFDKTTGVPYWESQLYDKVAKCSYKVSSRVFINAAGPYIDTINHKNKLTAEHQHVFSKGVHLIVKRLLPDRRALAFYANDGRLFFALPMGECTCIGTTDTPVTTASSKVLPEDRQFILNNINELLKLEQPLTERDIISERCGVRPLVQLAGKELENQEVDWFSLSRKHIIEQNKLTRHISIFGGKLTDCLNVGEEVYEVVNTWLPSRRYSSGEFVQNADKYLIDREDNKWEDIHARKRKQFLDRASQILPLKTASVLWRRYGQDGMHILEKLEAIHHKMLQESKSPKKPTSRKSLNSKQSPKKEWERLTAPIIDGYNVMVIEVEYALEHELVVELKDFLRRRTMLGLVVPQKTLKTNKTLIKIAKQLKKSNKLSK